MTWDEVAIKHGTDKASWMPGDAVGHGYMDHYESFLQNVVVQSVLEIGVASGDSIRTWMELFPAARVVGIEISADYAAQWDESMVVEIGDATKSNVIAEVVRKHGSFDFIVDDGSHSPPDVYATLRALEKHGGLRKGTMYSVEDLQKHQAEFFVDWVAGEIECERIWLIPDALAEQRPNQSGQYLVVVKVGGQ